MPTVSRAIRKAREVLASEHVHRPAVPVEKIAQKYGIVVREEMPDEISGMLVPLTTESGRPEWAIVVNSSHAPTRQRFTIAHELGHLLLHRYTTPHADGRFQIRFRDEDSSKGSFREEIEANQFAAELLMPENLVRSFVKLEFDLADAGSDGEAVEGLTRIAKRFKVSVQALSFRIANLSSQSA